MNLHKKLLSCVFVLAVALVCLFALPTEVQALTNGDYTYDVYYGEATITDCNTSISGNITIPTTLGGYPVTSIGNSAFQYCDSLTSVTIPDSVTSIGDEAFFGCDILTSVTIPDSVTSIGDYAFGYCHSLKSVTIGNSVTSIGESAFQYCNRLTAVNITDMAAWCKISFGDSSNPLYYAKNLYLNRKLVTNLVIPDGVTSIGDYAFNYCTSLTSVTIPDSVTSIGSSAFRYCDGLTSVTIGNSATSIGENAFCSCDSLTSIVVDNNNAVYSSDDKGVLFNKDKTTLIQAPGAITGNYVIPNSVTSIRNDAFYSCGSLTSVTIGNSVTSIGDWSFYSCDSLTSVTIGNSVTSIGNNAFWWCTSLTSVTIPDSVTSIGSSAFRYCDSLTSVTIPDSVTSIDDDAFYDCDSLTSVTYCGTEEQWNQITIAFGNEKLFAATRSYHDWQEATCAAPETCSICKLTAGEALERHNVVNGICTTCQRYGTCGDNLTWTIDDAGTLTISGTGAMWDWDYYSDNSPWYISRELIKNIVIENGLTSIGYCAFDGCTSLISVTIPNSVTNIGDYAFYECSSLTGVSIPDSITGIGDYAFWDCGSLTSVTYCGTEEQWNQIAIGTNNENLANATRSYHDYDDGVVTTAPTTSAPGVMTYTCVICNGTKTEVIPQLEVELFKIERTNVRMGSDLSLLFAFKQSSLKNVDGVYAEFTKAVYGEASKVTTVSSTDELMWVTATIGGEKYYVVEYAGLAAKEMADEITMVIRDADGNALSEAYTSSMKAYATEKLATSSNAEFKVALVDMLNYGAAAQAYFEYDTTNAANKDLTDEQKALSSAEGTYENALEADTEYYNATNLRFVSKINLLLRLKISKETYVVFTWNDHYGKSHEKRVDNDAYVTSSGMYVVELDELVVADARQKVTCTVYNLADDSVVTTVVESVEGEVANTDAGSAVKPLYVAFMKFADSAYAYMH